MKMMADAINLRGFNVRVTLKKQFEENPPLWTNEWFTNPKLVGIPDSTRYHLTTSSTMLLAGRDSLKWIQVVWINEWFANPRRLIASAIIFMTAASSITFKKIMVILREKISWNKTEGWESKKYIRYGKRRGVQTCLHAKDIKKWCSPANLEIHQNQWENIVKMSLKWDNL